jgi:hypothetical protein
LFSPTSYSQPHSLPPPQHFPAAKQDKQDKQAAKRRPEKKLTTADLLLRLE